MRHPLSDRWGRFMFFPTAGMTVAIYVVATGWAPRTPAWGRVVGLGFPVLVSAVFLWYSARYRTHEGDQRLARYVSRFGFAGGVVYSAPGVGIAVQQHAVGSPVLNANVFVLELWLGGCIVGATAGHFYALNEVNRVRLRRREAELEDHRRQLTILNRVFRHDVRNRLNVVLGSVAQLSVGDEQAALTDRVERSSRKILEMSEQARTMERLLRQEETERATDATETVARTVREVARAFPEAEIVVDARAERAPVVSNGHVDTAVENVVRNAVEHNDTESPTVEVTVELEPDRDAVVVRVADDGPGIPEREQSIFDRDEETQLRHSNGLGLWLVHQVVRDVDGAVGIDDRDPRGTEVTLRLPAAETAPEDGSRPAVTL